MVTGDGAYIKKINRSLILQNIMEYGYISRADLAKVTGLNKATISVQVADLLEEELICETQQKHNSIGRRPIMLSIHPNSGYILGIDLNYSEVLFSVSSFNGEIIESNTVQLSSNQYPEIITMLVEQIKSYQYKYESCRYGLVRTVIGIHGTVNKDESIHFIPTYQWRNIDLKRELEKELDIRISIENNANLSSLAEKVYFYHDSNSLLTIVLGAGIGAGIIINGELDKGYHGYAGEMGHMIIYPGGGRCTCGNHGCWELYASERSLLAQLADKLSRPITTYQDVQQLLKENDPIAIKLLKEFILNLSIGLNNIINIYNPETIVLNSKVLEIYPNAIAEIKENLHSNFNQFRQIDISLLGVQASVLGACAYGIQNFLDISQLHLTNNKYNPIREEIN